jgi:hypothetical protein
MNQRCDFCNSCGMPFEKPEDHAFNDESSVYCHYCVGEDGSLKSYDEVLQGMIGHFVESQGIDPSAARSMSEGILKKLPAWNG